MNQPFALTQKFNFEILFASVSILWYIKNIYMIYPNLDPPLRSGNLQGLKNDEKDLSALKQHKLEKYKDCVPDDTQNLKFGVSIDTQSLDFTTSGCFNTLKSLSPFSILWRHGAPL